MSNRGEAWKKFVQTFFLAEQPNGYFVLNDIFRFLKEETAESEEEREDEEASADEKPTASSVPEPTPVPPPQEFTLEPIEASPVPPVDEPEPVPEPQANGDQTPVVVEPEPAPEPESAPAEKSPIPPSATPEPPSTPVPESATSSIPKSSPSPAPPTQQVQSQLQRPHQQVPSQPKTWASLAAADPGKWGSAVAQESRGVSEVPVTSTPPNAPASPGPAPGRDQRPSQNRTEWLFEGIFEDGLEELVKTALFKPFGAVKGAWQLPNNRVYIEFQDPEGARKAIHQGRISISDGREGREGKEWKFVHASKERRERTVNRSRGGGPGQGVNGGGDGRGGYRGRGGQRGRGSRA